MTTSSADPDNLNVFVTQAGGATEQFSNRLRQVQSLFNDFQAAHYEVAHTDDRGLFTNLNSFSRSNLEDERFVAGVRTAFVQADLAPSPTRR